MNELCTPNTTNEPTQDPCADVRFLTRTNFCSARPWHHVRRSRKSPFSTHTAHTPCDETPAPPTMPKWLEKRPTKRSECPPPGTLCPWVSCRYHLQVDVVMHSSGGKRVIVRSDPDEWTENTKTCALTLADQGEMEWVEISSIYGRPPNKTAKRMHQKRSNRGEADRQQAYSAFEEMRESELMRDIAEDLGYNPDGRPEPGASSLPQPKPVKEDSGILALERLVNRAIERVEVKGAPIKDISPESFDLLSLLGEIRKKNGPPRGQRPAVMRVLYKPKIKYAAQERVESKPVEWIDL